MPRFIIYVLVVIALLLFLASCGGYGDTFTVHNPDGSDTECHTWEYHGTHTECRTFQ